MMPVVTVGHAFNQRGPLARAGSLHGSNRCLPDGENILTVHSYSGHVVSGCAVGNTWNRESVLNWSRLRITIIFANEHHRQLPNGCEVHGLVESTNASCPFAKKRGGYLFRLSHLRRQRGAHGMSRSHADDGVDAQHANADVGDVHRAAFTAIAAGCFPVEFGHHAVNFDTFCDAMPVAAMG